MLNRRELLFGTAGAVVARTLDLSIGQVRAVLKDVALEALTGIAASMMRPAASTCRPWLTLELRLGEARITLSEPNRECAISLRTGCEGFVASWALPVVQHGLIGYDPWRELPALLGSGMGEYWRLAEGDRLPASLREADAAYACFFGNYEPMTLLRMSEKVEELSAHLQPGADLIFTDATGPHHAPALLLTAFTR